MTNTSFVMTNTRYNKYFYNSNTYLSPQTYFCCDKYTFVTTKIILVAAPASDRGQFHENSIFTKLCGLLNLSFYLLLFLFVFVSLFFDGGGFGE